MKYYYLISLLSFCLLSVEIFGQNLDFEAKINKNIFNPNDIHFYSDSIIIIYDINNADPVYSYNFEKEEILGSIKLGKGPGEMSDRYKVLSSFQNEIFIWDSGNQYSALYDGKLNLINEYKFSLNHLFYGLYSFNQVFLVVDNSNNFIKLYENETYLTRDLKASYHASTDLEIFSEFKNNLIRQSIIFGKIGENAIIGHEYSSRITLINKNGINATTIAPYNIQLKLNGNEEELYQLPDLMDHKLAILDIATYKDKFIFVLFKGEKGNKIDLAKNFIDPNILLEEILHSNKILIYDEELNFIKEIKIKHQIKGFDIYNSILIGFSTNNDQSYLVKYNLHE